MGAPPLEGRVALVTGGSRGVGAQVARELASAGAKVALTYFRSPDAARQVVREIEAGGGQAISVHASAAESGSWERAATSVGEAYGDVDLLVSNAGVASRGRSICETDPAEFSALLDVHALGPLALIRALLPGMRAKSRSDVVMVSSSIVDACPPNSAPYTMAKAAMEAACKVLAREERAHNLRANIIAPGLIDTDMGAKLVAASTGGSSMAATELDAPFGRVCKPSDIARLVVYLTSDAGAYITGQRIVLDGGGATPSII
ncbi:oxidoreductase [Mycobacterium arosiense ATCC BAA-1401 = DSM 45069]|uniref:3-oxoacyl-[acyl-carrier-protein] reductase MabA n=1 Tax=Mycobacterium arosiense ATCC BAA-1401 = DSM 45069 TaxID=1265311 RepID=A0A1W9ZCG0_MYCAI|nr:oxidoreductase [Mycobacterium arosiense ATCC BAA-1401 = DSM 45069]